MDPHDVFLTSALSLAQHGLKVLPVARDTKKPLIEGWTTATATDDPARIERWWTGKFADANVGVSTGMSDLLVVEFDPRHGGDETFHEWMREYDTDFFKTVTAISGSGGQHLYYRAGGIRFQTTQQVIGVGVDTRGQAGMVVAPRSIHANGEPYRWERGYSPDDREMRPVPDFLKTLVPLARAPRAARRVRDGVVGLDAFGDVGYLRRIAAEAVAARRLDDLDKDDRFALAVQQHLGVPRDVALGRAFLCVLPGHAENSPSASLGRDNAGRWIYHDWHRRGGCPEYLTLADVYFSIHCGWVRASHGPTLAVWKLRLLHEMGLLDPAPVPMRPLPDDAEDDVRAVYDGFRDLLALKWTYEPKVATTFSWSFAEDWLNLDERRVAVAMRTLLKRKIIRKVGVHLADNGTPMAVFLPCRKA